MTTLAPLAGEPLVLGASPGLLYRATGPARGLGAVILNPFGFEALCSRRWLRALAQNLADSGVAALTFDWPGTGDAPGGEADQDLDLWLQAADLACETLKQKTGVERLMVVGQGLGASLASRLGGSRSDLARLALLGPVVRGRAWLRELAGWGAIVAEALKVDRDPLSPTTVAGYALPPRFAEQVHALDLMAEPPPRTPATLVAVRAARPVETQYAEALARQGLAVKSEPFEGYDILMRNPTEGYMPADMIRTLIDFVEAEPVAPRPARAQPSAPAARALITGDGFVEEVARIGDGGLIGVFCGPSGDRAPGEAAPPIHGPMLLILNAGLDPREGWARSMTLMARALARDGVRSLRIDGAGIGDSPPRPGGPAIPLYVRSLVDEVGLGVDALLTRGAGPIVVYGRCSGAWAALTAAPEDTRISRVILVNPQKYVVRDDQSLEAASEVLKYYRRRLAARPLFDRMLRREIDLKAAATRLAASGPPLARGALAHGSGVAHLIRSRFDALARRGVAVDLVLSDGSQAVSEFKQRFGEDGQGLRRWPNVRLSMIDHADHGFTSADAQRALTQLVREVAFETRSGDAPGRARIAAGRAGFAPRPRLGWGARPA